MLKKKYFYRELVFNEICIFDYEEEIFCYNNVNKKINKGDIKYKYYIYIIKFFG